MIRTVNYERATPRHTLTNFTGHHSVGELFEQLGYRSNAVCGGSVQDVERGLSID
nr:hypothetical protein [Pseudomonas mucidolens]